METGASTFTAYPRGEAPRLGVVFPQTRFFGTPVDIRAFATDVEALGFDHVLAYDHVLGASKATRPDWKGPYSSDDPFQEPFVLFSYIAAMAPSLEFATGVIILPQRQTALVAKQAANVDFLSGGKLRLGVGIGWNAVEFEGLNEEFGNRGKRFEEQIDVIRQVTSHEVIDYTGRWHRIDNAGIRPLGVQRPIPIWIGGSAEVAIRRGARIGDGFMINGVTAEAHDPALAILKNELARQGRDFSTYGVDMRVNVAQRDHDGWKRDFGRVRAAGVSHVTLVTISAEYAAFGEHMEHMTEAKRVWEEM
jgi:probable F420-dependent oxidoreductase